MTQQPTDQPPLAWQTVSAFRFACWRNERGQISDADLLAARQRMQDLYPGLRPDRISGARTVTELRAAGWHREADRIQTLRRDLEQRHAVDAAERAFDRLNPAFGVPADTHHPVGQRAVHDREAALALEVRVAVAASRENDPAPVLSIPGQDDRVADAARAAHHRHGARAGRPRAMTTAATTAAGRR
jgi:hypothetical protein